MTGRDKNVQAAIEEAANALQTAVLLAARVRSRMGEQFHEMIQCEAAVTRAAKALKGLSADGDSR
jgi:class 3 adenylate cyclase